MSRQPACLQLKSGSLKVHKNLQTRPKATKGGADQDSGTGGVRWLTPNDSMKKINPLQTRKSGVKSTDFGQKYAQLLKSCICTHICVHYSMVQPLRPYRPYPLCLSALHTSAQDLSPSTLIAIRSPFASQPSFPPHHITKLLSSGHLPVQDASMMATKWSRHFVVMFLSLNPPGQHQTLSIGPKMKSGGLLEGRMGGDGWV
jgi:hypothetical protein